MEFGRCPEGGTTAPVMVLPKATPIPPAVRLIWLCGGGARSLWSLVFSRVGFLTLTFDTKILPGCMLLLLPDRWITVIRNVASLKYGADDNDNMPRPCLLIISCAIHFRCLHTVTMAKRKQTWTFERLFGSIIYRAISFVHDFHASMQFLNELPQFCAKSYLFRMKNLLVLNI